MVSTSLKVCESNPFCGIARIRNMKGTISFSITGDCETIHTYNAADGRAGGDGASVVSVYLETHLCVFFLLFLYISKAFMT